MYISSYLGLRQSLIHIQRTSVEVVHAVFLCNKDLIKSSDFEIENSLYLQVLEALPVTLYISYYMSYYSWLYLGCWYLTYALQSYFVPNGKSIMVFWFNLWLLLQVLFFGWMNIRGNWGALWLWFLHSGPRLHWLKIPVLFQEFILFLF